MTDNSVQIVITGEVDDSLTDSTEAATAELSRFGDVAATAAERAASAIDATSSAARSAIPAFGAASAGSLHAGLGTPQLPNIKGAGIRIADPAKAREQADEIIRLTKETTDAKIRGEKQANEAALTLGKESLAVYEKNALDEAQVQHDADLKAAAQKVATGKMSGAEYTATATLADQQLANQQAEIKNQVAEKQRRIDDQTLQDHIKSQEAMLDRAKAALNTEFATHQVSAQERRDLEVQLTQNVEQEILSRLDAEISGLAQGTEAWRQATEQRQQFVDAMNKRIQVANEQLATGQFRQWQSVDQNILSAESSFVSDILTKRQSLTKDLRQVGVKMLESEIQSDVKSLTEQALTSLNMLAPGNVSPGGLLMQGFNAVFGSGSGGANANLATNTALQAAVNLNTSALNANTLALQGASASNTTSSGGGIFGSLGNLFGGGNGGGFFSEIGNVFSSIGSIFGFDVGTPSVPFDQLAMIHKGEMIVPAEYAELVRQGNAAVGYSPYQGISALPGAAAGSRDASQPAIASTGVSGVGEGQGGGLHVHNHYHSSTARDLEKLVQHMAPAAIRAARNIHRSGALRF